MTIPFRSVAEAQAFASAFSKATAGTEGTQRLSLNSTLHCLAVASKFKNWPTMKTHLEKQGEEDSLPAKKFLDLPPMGVRELATLFREGKEPRHLTYSSLSQVNRILAAQAAIQSAKRVGLDVIVIANDMDTLNQLDLDLDPLFLDTPPGPLWKMDAPISLGYCNGLIRSKESTEGPLSTFLANLRELQTAKLEASKKTGEVEARGIHVLLEPHRCTEGQLTGIKFSQAATEELRRIIFQGRSLKISVGYLFESSYATPRTEHNDLIAEVLKQSSTVHKD